MMNKSDNQIFDLYRSGLEAFLDLSRTSVQGAERLREQQLKAINEAFSEAGDTGRQIGSAKTLEELLELQAKLAPTQLEKAMRYWGGLYATGARNQVEIMQQMQAKVSNFTEACCATLDAAPQGTEPVVAPLKSAVTAMCSAYTLTARAGEEAAKLAVSQIESANANMRQTAQAAGQTAQAAAQAAQGAGHHAGSEGRRKAAA
jgi:phasin family protein